MARIFFNSVWNTFRYSDNKQGCESSSLRHLNSKRSTEWPAVRRAHLKAHPTCAACGSKFAIEVHHIIPYQYDPTKELNPDNLITLCDDENSKIRCHLYFGHLGNFNRYNPSVRQDAAYNLLLLQRKK